MPGSAEFVQRAVHALEAGALAVWVRRSLLALAVIALAIYYFYDFRGLATSQAMDQAQIGRAIASGHGWRTNVVRPRAIGQLQANGKDVAQKIWSDTYNAPLPPFVDAIALWPVKSHWQMSPSDLVYAGDKAIAAMSIFLFLLSVFFFRPRGWTVLILLAAFTAIYAPWLIRNYIVCGHPGGVAIYSVLDGIRHSEAGWMRRISLDVEGIGPRNFRDKITTNFFSQSGHIFEYFGSSVVAMMFFAALLHPFKRTETAMLRWMILAMWIGALAGMAIFGINEEEDIAANQLHLIFVPLMTCYGLAYLLVQWRRLGIGLRLARIAFVALLYLLCAGPMISAIFLSQNKSVVHWPPYMPPLIAVMNDWMKPQEITASDMPWAVAWYADRRSIWLPDTTKNFTELSDYGVLGAPINGLYLTPVSGAENTFRDIVKGEYRDWAPAIQRTLDLEKFPLKWATLGLGLDAECVFFSDHDRQKDAQTP